MKCYIENCQSFPLLICSCVTEGILICENHFESHLSCFNKYPHIAVSTFDSSNIELIKATKKNDKCFTNQRIQNLLNDSQKSQLNFEIINIDKEIQTCINVLRSSLPWKLAWKRNFKVGDYDKDYVINNNSEIKSYTSSKAQENELKFSVLFINEKLANLISHDILKWSSIDTFKNSYFNKIDIKAIPEVCRILKDFLSEEAQESLLKLTLLSKESSEVIIGSTNAITILNRIGYSLCHKDLRGIKIPGADLSSSLIIGTNFEGSDLKNVSFAHANLYSVNFDDCNMDKDEFGQSYLSPFKTAGTVLKFSPCGKYVALSKENDRDLLVWDISNQKLLTSYHNDYRFNYCEFSHCGKYLACLLTMPQYSIVLLDVQAESSKVGSVVQRIKGLTVSVCSLAFSLCSTWIAVGSRSNDIRFWDIYTKKWVKYLCGHDSPVISLAFSKNYLMSASDNGSILIWNINLPRTKTIVDFKGKTRNVKNKQLVWKLKSKDKLTGVQWAHDEKYFFTWSKQRVFMWNIKKQEERTLFSSLKIDFHEWALSPCSNFIAVSSKNGLVQVFDVKNQVFTVQFPMKSSSDPKIAFSPSANKLAIAGKNDYVRSWKYKLPSWKTPESTNRKDSFMVQWSPIEDQFILISKENAVGAHEIWSYKNKKVIQKFSWQFELEVNPIFAFSPCGNYFVLSNCSGLQLYRSTLEFVRNYPSQVTSFSVSREGLIALGFFDGSIEIAELYSNKLICKIERSTNKNAHSQEIKFLSFSYSSLILASASNGRVIRFWNAQTGNFISQRQINRYKWSDRQLISLIFAPYENYLAFTIKPCNWVKVCNANSLEKATKFYGSSLLSYSQVKFSPCGLLLAAISLNFTLDIWNLKNKMLIYILKGHLETITSFDFSLCGSRIISGSEDMTIKCWNIGHLYDDSKEANSTCLEWSLTKWELVASDISLSGATISKKNRKLLNFLSKLPWVYFGESAPKVGW